MSRLRDAARNRRAVYTSPGTELVRRLAERGERIFTVKEAGQVASKVGLSAGYLHEGLHHLARSGWIVRLRKGLYALSGGSRAHHPPMNSRSRWPLSSLRPSVTGPRSAITD